MRSNTSSVFARKALALGLAIAMVATGPVMSPQTSVSEAKKAKSVTVDTQKELKKALKKNVGTIVIGKKAKDLTIPSGNYGKTTMVVNAPKASITNNGKFKSIKIKGNAAKAWTEKSKAKNNITISSQKPIDLKVDAKAQVGNLIINGSGETESNISVSGKVGNVTVKGSMSVNITAEGSGKVTKVVISASVTVSIDANGKSSVSKIDVSASGADIGITASGSSSIGTVDIKASAGTSDNKTKVEIKAGDTAKVDNVKTAAENADVAVVSDGESTVSNVKVEGNGSASVSGDSQNVTTVDVKDAGENAKVTVNTPAVKVEAGDTTPVKDIVENRSGQDIETTVTKPDGTTETVKQPSTGGTPTATQAPVATQAPAATAAPAVPTAPQGSADPAASSGGSGGGGGSSSGGSSSGGGGGGSTTPSGGGNGGSSSGNKPKATQTPVPSRSTITDANITYYDDVSDTAKQFKFDTDSVFTIKKNENNIAYFGLKNGSSEYTIDSIHMLRTEFYKGTQKNAVRRTQEVYQTVAHGNKWLFSANLGKKNIDFDKINVKIGTYSSAEKTGDDYLQDGDMTPITADTKMIPDGDGGFKIQVKAKKNVAMDLGYAACQVVIKRGGKPIDVVEINATEGQSKVEVDASGIVTFISDSGNSEYQSTDSVEVYAFYGYRYYVSVYEDDSPVKDVDFHGEKIINTVDGGDYTKLTSELIYNEGEKHFLRKYTNTSGKDLELYPQLYLYKNEINIPWNNDHNRAPIYLPVGKSIYIDYGMVVDNRISTTVYDSFKTLVRVHEVDTSFAESQIEANDITLEKEISHNSPRIFLRVEVPFSTVAPDEKSICLQIEMRDGDVVKGVICRENMMALSTTDVYQGDFSISLDEYYFKSRGLDFDTVKDYTYEAKVLYCTRLPEGRAAKMQSLSAGNKIHIVDDNWNEVYTMDYKKDDFGNIIISNTGAKAYDLGTLKDNYGPEVYYYKNTNLVGYISSDDYFLPLPGKSIVSIGPSIESIFGGEYDDCRIVVHAHETTEMLGGITATATLQEGGVVSVNFKNNGSKYARIGQYQLVLKDANGNIVHTENYCGDNRVGEYRPGYDYGTEKYVLYSNGGDFSGRDSLDFFDLPAGGTITDKTEVYLDEKFLDQVASIDINVISWTR